MCTSEQLSAFVAICQVQTVAERVCSIRGNRFHCINNAVILVMCSCESLGNTRHGCCVALMQSHTLGVSGAFLMSLKMVLGRWCGQVLDAISSLIGPCLHAYPPVLQAAPLTAMLEEGVWVTVTFYGVQYRVHGGL